MNMQAIGDIMEPVNCPLCTHRFAAHDEEGCDTCYEQDNPQPCHLSPEAIAEHYQHELVLLRTVVADTAERWDAEGSTTTTPGLSEMGNAAVVTRKAVLRANARLLRTILEQAR